MTKKIDSDGLKAEWERLRTLFDDVLAAIQDIAAVVVEWFHRAVDWLTDLGLITAPVDPFSFDGFLDWIFPEVNYER